MEEKQAEVISGLRSCLVSTKGRCDLKQMSDDFRILMGYKIPFVQLGFKTLEQFILSIPSLSTSRVNGQLLIDAKPSEKSSHIASLVDKQKGTKKRSTRPPPRYAGYRYMSQQAVPRWRPKNVQRNWKKTYQSSPRPAAVSHNQFVNVPSSPKSSNLPLRLANRSASAREIAPRYLSMTEEPVSVRVERKDPEIESDSLSTKAKKRITQRMADINIHSNNGYTNGAAGGMGFSEKGGGDQWNAGPRSAPILTPSEIQKLRQESLAAIDLQNPIWKWSGSDDSPEKNDVLQQRSKQKTSPQNIQMEFTGDYLLDLHNFAAAHKLGKPTIKVKSRKGKLEGKSEKVTLYDCHIKVGNHSFSSYPADFLDEDSAKQAAAKFGLDELLSIYSRRQSQSLLISDDKDILERIPPLVQSHYSGIWNTQLEADYAEIFNEQLPINWLEVVDTIPCITVLPLLDKRFVLRFCKPGEKGAKFTTLLSSQVSVPSNTVKFNNDGMLMAEITCVASAGEIWCRQIDTPESEAFNEMIGKLDKHYGDVGEYEIVDSIEVGAYYVAYSDFTWCRVRVFEVNGNTVNCFCIDYGDEWILQKSSIYRLQRQFALVQAQAFVCRLAGVEEIYEASKSSSYLNTLISKIVQVQLDPSDDANRNSPSDPALSVILYDEAGIAINEQLVSVISIELAMPILNQNSPTEVYVTHAMDDGSLYVQVHSIGYEQLSSMLQVLENDLLEDKLNLPKEQVTPHNSKDRIYFTQCNEDGHWYRAKIIDWAPDKNYAQIMFVDYGTTAIIKIMEHPMYPLDELSDVISQFPEQAVRVRMALKHVSINFVDRIVSLMPPGQPVIVKIIEDSKDGPVVEFFKRSETDNVLFSVNAALSVEIELKNASGDGNNNTGKLQSKLQSAKLQRLISLNQFDGTSKNVPSSGFLSCPPLPAVEEWLDVKIPCAVNPYNFFVQPYESQDKLSKLMVAMQERYKDMQYSPLQIEDVQPGKIYASKYGDGLWYRTSVMKVIHHGSISVFYCDFGYYANLNLKQLVPLDPEFMELPHQVIKAKLAGIEPKNSKWSMDDCKFFEKLVCRKSFVSLLVAKEMDDLYQYDTLLSLKLIDTSSDVDVHIDKLLVKEGIAKFIEPHA